jgi:hypothetical protein
VCKGQGHAGSTPATSTNFLSKLERKLPAIASATAGIPRLSPFILHSANGELRLFARLAGTSPFHQGIMSDAFDKCTADERKASRARSFLRAIRQRNNGPGGEMARADKGAQEGLTKKLQTQDLSLDPQRDEST